MRNKRIILISVITAAVLCIGVGYAALSDTLTVGGKVSVGVNEFSPNVKFSDVSVSAYSTANGVSSGVNVEIANQTSDVADANDKIDITVPNTVLTAKGDKVTVEAVIANYSEKYKARVTLKNTTSASAGLYSVTCKWEDGTSEPAVIDMNGGSNKVIIVIELLKTPTEVINNDKFEITYNAVSVDP